MTEWKNRLREKEFWLKAGLFLLIFGSIAACDPLLHNAFWLWKGEIAAVVNFWRLVFPYAVLLSFLIFAVRRKGRLNYGALAFLVLLYGCYILSTALNGGNMEMPLSLFRNTFQMFLLACLCCGSKEGKRLYIKAGADVFWLVALANLLLVFVLFRLHPEYTLIDGQYQESFTGNKNQFGFVLYIGMLYCLLDAHLFPGRSSKLRLWLYVPLMLLNAYAFHKCATLLIGAAILTLYMLPPLRKLTEKIPFWVFLVGNILLFVLLMFFFDEFTALPPVVFLVTKVLHKKITLTGRVFIWQGILEEILQHPIRGYGMLGSSFFFDDVYNHTFVHCHNQYLQTWHEAGLPGLLSLPVLLGFTGFRLRRCSDRRLAGIFKIILFVLMLTLQSDQNTFCACYLLAITAHLGVLLTAEGRSWTCPGGADIAAAKQHEPSDL